MLTRRGFLGTMLAAAAGAVANFDITKKLWVPGRIELTDAPAPLVTEVPVLSWTKDVIGNQADLNDVALRFAQAMAPQLARTQATVLRRMMLEQVGHIDVGTIHLTDDDGNPAGRGHFQPAVHRVAKDLETAHRGYAARTSMEDAAAQMYRDVQHFDAFAPIGANLRDETPFADCLVGTATDPASGLSARALRFKTTDGIVHTECELAVGNWYGKGAHARRQRQRGDTVRVLLSPELLAAQEAQWQAEAADPSSVRTERDSDGERRDSLSIRFVKEWDRGRA